MQNPAYHTPGKFGAGLAGFALLSGFTPLAGFKLLTRFSPLAGFGFTPLSA